MVISNLKRYNLTWCHNFIKSWFQILVDEIINICFIKKNFGIVAFINIIY